MKCKLQRGSPFPLGESFLAKGDAGDSVRQEFPARESFLMYKVCYNLKQEVAQTLLGLMFGRLADPGRERVF